MPTPNATAPAWPVQEIAALRKSLDDAPDEISLRNCIEGDNYLRGGEYRQLIALRVAADSLLAALEQEPAK